MVVPELIYDYGVPQRAIDAASRLPTAVSTPPPGFDPNAPPPEVRFEYIVPRHAQTPPPQPPKKPGG
jgi:hypothetical protein